MHRRLNAEQVMGILNIAENAIFCTDEGQQIALFNRGADRVLGWRASEAGLDQ